MELLRGDEIESRRRWSCKFGSATVWGGLARRRAYVSGRSGELSHRSCDVESCVRGPNGVSVISNISGSQAETILYRAIF